MGSGEISIQMSGDAQKLFKELAKTKAKLGEVQQKLGRVARESGKVETSQKAAFNAGTMRKFAGALTGVGGILAAYKLITAELVHQKRIEREALTTQLGVNVSRQGLIRNLAMEQPTVVRNMLKFGSRLATKTQVPQAVVFEALASAYSAAGGNIPLAREAVSRSAMLLPDVPTTIAATAGTLIDLSRATGSADARYNQGYLTSLAAASRITDPAAIARNVPGAIIGQTNLGASPATAGALFAALTTGSADILGATSGTGAISLVQQLKKAFPDLTTFEAISKLQGSDRASAEFVETLSLEKKILGPAITLLTDATSKIAKEFTATRKTLGDKAGILATADRSIGMRAVDPLEATAQTTRLFASAVESFQISNLEGGQMAAVREGLIKTLDAMGEGALSSKIADVEFEVRARLGRRGPLFVARDMLRDRMFDLREGGLVTDSAGGMFGSKFRRPDVVVPPTTAELRLADALKEMIMVLLRIEINQQSGGNASLGSPNVDK